MKDAFTRVVRRTCKDAINHFFSQNRDADIYRALIRNCLSDDLRQAIYREAVTNGFTCKKNSWNLSA